MGQFGDMLMNAVGGGIGGAINQGMGILFGRSQEDHNDQRQYDQQARLQQLQIQGQQQMTDYNWQKQLDMWNATNYEAQMKHLKEAGLNPALLYGKGGGGGATANITPGNVTGANAPQGGGEVIENTGMAIQNQKAMAELQLLTAQKENIQADTAKKEADTTYTSGAQTNKTNAEVDNLLQTYDNLRQDYDYTKLKMSMQNILNYEQQASQADRLSNIRYDAESAMRSAKILGAKQKVEEGTIQAQITTIRKEAIQAGLQNVLTMNGIDKAKWDTLVSRNEVAKIINGIEIEWQKLGNEQKRTRIQEQLQQFSTDPLNKGVDQIVDLLDGIISKGRY